MWLLPLGGCVAGMWHVAAEAVESEIIVRYFLSSSRLGLIMPLLWGYVVFGNS